MVWYSNLYVGRVIASRKDKVINAIDHGRYSPDVYVVIVPESESSQLEIMSSSEFRHDYIRKHCLMIVGLAMGKTEAQSIVTRIVGDVYSDRGDANIRAWLSEKH